MLAVMGQIRPFRRRRRGVGLSVSAAGVFVFAFVAALQWPGRPEASGPSVAAEAATFVQSVAAEVATFGGRPTRITDGDTLRFGETRVRLHGVDAPEMSTAEGREARRRLKALVGNGEVRCRDTGQRSYERVVAVCYDAGGRDLAAAMVEAGWARDWPRYSGGRYAGHQRRAEASGAGLYAR